MTHHFNTLRPKQNGHLFAGDSFKCIFLNENFWFPMKFHRNMFHMVQLTIWQHWFRWWLGAEQASSHYLKQCWCVLLTLIFATRPQWVNGLMNGTDNRACQPYLYMSCRQYISWNMRAVLLYFVLFGVNCSCYMTDVIYFSQWRSPEWYG